MNCLDGGATFINISLVEEHNVVVGLSVIQNYKLDKGFHF